MSTQLMISGDNRSLVTTLIITSVQPFDAGGYQCRASIDPNNIVIIDTVNLCIKGMIDYITCHSMIFL